MGIGGISANMTRTNTNKLMSRLQDEHIKAYLEGRLVLLNRQMQPITPPTLPPVNGLAPQEQEAIRARVKAQPPEERRAEFEAIRASNRRMQEKYAAQLAAHQHSRADDR